MELEVKSSRGLLLCGEEDRSSETEDDAVETSLGTRNLLIGSVAVGRGYIPLFPK